MDQITHSRDMPIFVRNFPRWRAVAGDSPPLGFGSTASRFTRSANPENSTLVPNMWIAHYWLFSNCPS